MYSLKKALIGTALAASTIAGGVAGVAAVDGAAYADDSNATTAATQAATTSDSASNSASTKSSANDQNGSSNANRPMPDPTKGGHVGQNGKTEEILTGDAATKAKAAAEKAVPGATVLRVETDAEGVAYEAHMKTTSGEFVTVKMDTNFNVTGQENGFGNMPGGRAPNGAASSTNSTSANSDGATANV